VVRGGARVPDCPVTDPAFFAASTGRMIATTTTGTRSVWSGRQRSASMTSWEKVSPHYRCGIWRLGRSWTCPHGRQHRKCAGPSALR
jgi:hypothetical protein